MILLQVHGSFLLAFSDVRVGISLLFLFKLSLLKLDLFAKFVDLVLKAIKIFSALLINFIPIIVILVLSNGTIHILVKIFEIADLVVRISFLYNEDTFGVFLGE